MVTKRIAPVALQALTEALRLAYWYKSDLRRFLHSSITNRPLVAQLDWDAPKRQVATQLVDTLAGNQARHFETIITLMFDLCDLGNLDHLKRVEDGEAKHREAVNALHALRIFAEPYRASRSAEAEAQRRQAAEHARQNHRRAIAGELSRLHGLFIEVATEDPQTRGYKLEKLLNDLFALFDIDAKAPFRIHGEQIDGAFSLDGSEFILEAKWHQSPTPLADLDVFSAKIRRKLDNTLGLFVSINGYMSTAVERHASGDRPSILLMTGADLMTVLDDRIPLPDLILRKRQHAARTGHILLEATSIL